MKNQEVKNGLNFNKNSLVELNDQQAHQVDSGSSFLCLTAGSTPGCITTAIIVGVVVIGTIIREQ